MSTIAGNLYPYWIVIFLIMTGLYITMAYSNMIKKMIGLNIFQTGVFVFLIAIGKKHNALPPLLSLPADSYANPTPHVLVLTAIVVAFSTTLLGLALILRTKRQWGSIDEDKIPLLPEKDQQ